MGSIPAGSPQGLVSRTGWAAAVLRVGEWQRGRWRRALWRKYERTGSAGQVRLISSPPVLPYMGTAGTAAPP